MLDIDLQKRLDKAAPLTSDPKTGLSTPQLWIMAIVIALLSATLSVLTYDQLTQPTMLPTDELGKLAVMISNETGTIPADIWAAMERHIGKHAAEFTPDDQMKAVSFLLYLMEKQPSETINIW